MKSILLVEDDPFLIDIYSTKLKEAGFSVKIAIDGKEALKKVKKDIPDLLILDIVLPNFNGWEILRKIERDDQLKALKVIILSNGINSKFSDIDTYWMAASIIDEAIRNIIAVGGSLEQIAILDNLILQKSPAAHDKFATVSVNTTSSNSSCCASVT